MADLEGATAFNMCSGSVVRTKIPGIKIAIRTDERATHIEALGEGCWYPPIFVERRNVRDRK